MKKYMSSIQSVFMLTVVLFWGIPFVKDLLPAKDAQEIIRTCIYLVNPCFCFAAGYFCEQKEQKTWYLPLGILLIYVPLPFLFYEMKDLFALPIYVIACLLGMAFVSLYHKIKKN